ncbi:MAG: hypothetical protein GXP31_14460 [Kiritimatiellaeota bacterium]|nr:hypothetical protein [Kiritimatiellota bacterium]
MRALVVTLLLVARSLPALELRITATPAVQNLAPNPCFELGRDDRPAGWSFGTAVPDIFQSAWTDGGRTGKCLRVQATSGKMSGYWNAPVPLVSGRRYRFSGWYRIKGGRILCYVHARKRLPKEYKTVTLDERFYAGSFRQHWLVPVFIPPDALPGPKPDQWYRFDIVFTAPAPLTGASISLGMYFTPGLAFFDDVFFGPAETTLDISATTDATDRVRRIVVMAPGHSKPLADTGGLEPFQTECELRVPHVPTDTPITVRVTLESGRTVTRIWGERN